MHGLQTLTYMHDMERYRLSYMNPQAAFFFIKHAYYQALCVLIMHQIFTLKCHYYSHNATAKFEGD